MALFALLVHPGTPFSFFASTKTIACSSWASSIIGYAARRQHLPKTAHGPIRLAGKQIAADAVPARAPKGLGLGSRAVLAAERLEAEVCGCGLESESEATGFVAVALAGVGRPLTLPYLPNKSSRSLTSVLLERLLTKRLLPGLTYSSGGLSELVLQYPGEILNRGG